MRISRGVLIALAFVASCTEDTPRTSVIRGYLSPDAQTLQELERAAELGESRATPEAVCETLELCPKPPEKPRGIPEKTAAVTPPSELPERSPIAPERNEEIAIDRPMPDVAPAPRPNGARAAAPLAPRAVTSPEPPEPGRNMMARDVALGVGGTSLMVSAVTMGANVEARSNVGYAIGGITLGIGVIGLATAGILTLTQDNVERDRDARVKPTGDGFQVSF